MADTEPDSPYFWLPDFTEACWVVMDDNEIDEDHLDVLVAQWNFRRGDDTLHDPAPHPGLRHPPKGPLPLPPLRPGHMLSGKPLTRLHPYATDRMRKRKHVGLWYFTRAGLEEAETLPCYPDSHWSLFRNTETEVVAVGPSWAKGSKSFVEDKDLSWYDWTFAKITFTEVMQDNEWPQKVLDEYRQFFTNLDYHNLRRSNPVTGDRVLTDYLHYARLDFHAQMDNGVEGDLATICPQRLEWSETRIRNEEDAKYVKFHHMPR